MLQVKSSLTAILEVALALAAAATPALAQDTPVTFHATAVNLSNVGRQGMTTLDITIERWNTDEEFTKLKDATLEKGSGALLKELQKIRPRAGYVRRSTGGVGWDIQYARKTDLPSGSSRVIFATDRPMSFAEAASRPRSADYEFLLGEIRIGPDGKGEGKLVPMAKIAYDESSRTLQIEDYASEPVRLTKVIEEKRKATSVR
jgi:hypothetical protein